jgi:hypothetical protein
MSIKSTLVLASIVIVGAGPAALAASTARHGHPARAHATAQVNSQAAKRAYGYAWRTQRHEPTYMGVEDQMDRDSLGE